MNKPHIKNYDAYVDDQQNEIGAMTYREKIESMSHEELKQATIPLVEYLGQERYLLRFDEAMKLLKAFGPSPLDAAMTALKAAGFTHVGDSHSIPWEIGDVFLCSSECHLSGIWRKLPESAT